MQVDLGFVPFERLLPLSRSDAWARFLRDVGHWEIMGFGLFSVVERTTAAYVGKVGFAIFERDLGCHAGTNAEISWTLRSQFHGRGFATEAAKAAQHWFESKYSQRTACLIAAANTSSIKLATRLGYEEVDRLSRDRGEAVVMARQPVR
ncbi:GNAT family N-acetyltransferase [Sinorhizobium meliloti]|uniref:GNAT family N-acetyltransferase n=1 Tax=Rhizobium meliloti TaxID=382 RepID=UPI00067F706E|nr:GNAT family N-acetyltransferase [Sinorhizobium meliloti]